MTTTTVDTQAIVAGNGGTSTPVKLTLQDGTAFVAAQLSVAVTRAASPSMTVSPRKVFNLCWAFSPDDITLADVPSELKLCTKTQSLTIDPSKPVTFKHRVQVRAKTDGQYCYYWFEYPASEDAYSVVIKSTEATFPSSSLSLSSVTLTQAGIATTSTSALTLQNTTASTSGVPVQYSPRQFFRGHAWNTTATAADNYLDAIVELRPVSAATPTSNLVWGFRRSTDGTSGSFTDAMTLSSAGGLTIVSTLTFGTSASTLVGTTGAIGLNAVGSNQSITLAPTGTGVLAVNSTDTGTVVSANFLAGSAANGSTVNWRYGVAVATGNAGAMAFGYTSTNHASNYLQLGIVGQAHITMFNSGNIWLGNAPVDGTGKLQFPTGTTSAHGIMLGNVPIFQSASSVGNLGGAQWVFPNGVAIGSPGLRPDGGSGSGLFFSGSTFYVTSGAALVFATNTGTTALTLDSSQNATFAGFVKPMTVATGSAPTYAPGVIYFDTTLNKLRVGGAAAYETITSV